MAEVVKVLYIMVVDEEEKIEEGKESFRYTRPVLQSTLQFMGCKARHAFKISQRVFQKIREESSTDALLKEEQLMRVDASKRNPGEENSSSTSDDSEKPELSTHLDTEKDDRSKTVPFELYKRLTTVVVRRETFLNVVCNALTEYKYVGPNQRADLVLACRIRERKGSVTILLCGPSGCGKSTLSALLGSRLGITTVVSTDSIRHMMRSYVDEKQCPLLWASTYHAGEVLDPVAVADAKARRKARKLANVDNFPSKDQSSNDPGIMKLDIRAPNVDSVASEPLSQKQMAIEGFKAQSEMVIDGLDRLITVWEERRESVVVEGVHLSLNFVMGLMKKHPSIIPFMMYIANEDKHLERFAVRAKYMTLDPAKNRYVKYIKNIRTIQEYLCKQADKHLVPKINNTNIDKSVAAIHATVFSCLRRREAGERLYDPVRNTVSLVDEEYRNQCVANSLSSKGMFQLIQREGGSSRRLMALLNNDGSVARTWSIGMTDGNESNVVDHVKKGSEIGKAEPVNLCFGHFGISAWTTDDCSCSSHAGSLNEPKADGMEVGSKCYSSCCSSPSDGPAKELMEDHSVYGSDEEVDNMPDEDSDEDLSDGGDKHDPEEVGSVDEESFLSDEDYDDLALNLAKLDAQVGGYWANEEQEARDKYIQNLDRFLETVKELQVEPQRFCSSSLTEKGGKKVNNFGIAKTRRRSVSIPAFESSILSSSPMR